MATKKEGPGKPLRFKTVKELEDVIEKYFDWCDNRLVQGYDNKTNEQFAYLSPAPYTMSGLARRIGLSRQALLDYENRDSYMDTIKRARARVHEDVETRLMEKAPTGAIFNLKNNFGWRDEQHTDITTDGQKIEPMVIYKPEKRKIDDIDG
jgi:DNA-binding XRE family transcriptional regulator